MRVGDFVFSPRLWAILLFAALFACMLWLGNWQLDRAALKVSMQEAADQSQRGPAVPIAQVSDFHAAAAIYQRVSLEGVFEPDKQFLWDNRTRGGRAGFEVVIPFRLADGQRVLINRGWIPPEASRAILPDVSLPGASASSELVSIEGLLSKPSKGFASGRAVETIGPWPRILQYFDYDAMGSVLNEPLLPVVVQPQSVAADGLSVTSYSDRDEWLQANWQPAASGPSKHYSYAFQWYAMACALCGIFVIVNTRRQSRTASES